jgi:hypothetical protein
MELEDIGKMEINFHEHFLPILIHMGKQNGTKCQKLYLKLSRSKISIVYQISTELILSYWHYTTN